MALLTLFQCKLTCTVSVQITSVPVHLVLSLRWYVWLKRLSAKSLLRFSLFGRSSLRSEGSLCLHYADRLTDTFPRRVDLRD